MVPKYPIITFDTPSHLAPGRVRLPPPPSRTEPNSQDKDPVGSTDLPARVACRLLFIATGPCPLPSPRNVPLYPSHEFHPRLPPHRQHCIPPDLLLTSHRHLDALPPSPHTRRKGSIPHYTTYPEPSHNPAPPLSLAPPQKATPHPPARDAWPPSCRSPPAPRRAWSGPPWPSGRAARATPGGATP